ncbi:MAG: DNA-3-methyladenine glycosylase [Bacteroidales bacterium]|nr:DNA-3-methyladenine glycosylase [Bacteroidales bacterium]
MLLDQKFFDRDVLKVAPDLIGKIIVREFDDGSIKRFRITQTEAYRGEKDKACHASKGRTPRTEIMYHKPGTIYVYLIYGMYWMLNFVTAKSEIPQAVLIRAIEGYNGPGKLSKILKIDKTFNDQSIVDNQRIKLFDDLYKPQITTDLRIGVDYAGEIWAQKPWRFIDNSLT